MPTLLSRRQRAGDPLPLLRDAVHLMRFCFGPRIPLTAPTISTVSGYIRRLPWMPSRAPSSYLGSCGPSGELGAIGPIRLMWQRLWGASSARPTHAGPSAAIGGPVRDVAIGG